MKSGATIFFLVVSIFCGGQNLVPNPSFEKYYSCPTTYSQVGFKDFAPGWTSPTQGTPDLFNRCSIGTAGVPRNWAGVSRAYDGWGYAGIYVWIERVDYREYLQAKLKEPLQAGRKYWVEFYFRLSAYSKYSIDRIGVLLSDSTAKADHDLILTLAPSYNHIMDSAYNKGTGLWNRVHFEYVAKGGEQYITLGNFSTNEATKKYLIANPLNDQPLLKRAAYFYIDDVAVIPLETGSEIIKDSLSIAEATVKPDETYTLRHIRFSYNSYELLSSSFAELDRLVTILQRNPSWNVELSGHTDDQGTDAYNLQLSQSRATSVGEYLVQKGISNGRIHIYGYGKKRPVIQGTDDDARTVNRRVEAKFVDRPPRH
ncbi:MAG: OmpA family protein [Bacteroidetes bacterium]|nr:OmpA family protein [Bacteroidota bacterium]MBS1541329.1 OmpA family protein [Bacteroidota bacterium]